MGKCPNQNMPPQCVMLDVLRNPFFAKGYSSVFKGKLHNTANYSVRRTWFYERGRFVAGEALEKLGHVPKLRLVRHMDNRDDGIIVNPIVVDLAWPMLADMTNPYTGPDFSQQKFYPHARGARA